MADKSRLAELTRALETKTKEISEAANAFTIEDNGGVVVTPEIKTTYLKNVADAQEIKALIQAEKAVDEIHQWQQAPATASASQSVAVEKERGGFEGKSLADMLMDSEIFQTQVKSPAPYIKVEFDQSLFDFETKDVYGTSAGRTGGDVTLPTFGRAQDLGITDVRLRQAHVRDLFPKATTDAAVLHGIRETGFTNNAAVVPVRNAGNTDFGLKPMSDITFTSVTYPIATIAHLLRAHRNILADEARLRDFINRRMVDGVKLAEDAEILYGTGGGESITGIMNTPGVQSFVGAAADPLSAQLRRAATLAMISEYEPNGIVVHPTDWEDLELEVTGNGEYRLAVNVAIGGQKRVWGMNIVTTTAMNATEFLLGSFGLGATLYDREQVGVMVSTEDSDNFRRNAITIRAEERVALEVSRPESFISGTLTPYVPA
jgi:HK97 family phage major capsid protein